MTGITFDEIEKQLKETEGSLAASKLEEMKLEGADVPENLRGKTAREALNHIKALEDSLRTSEGARQQALTMAQLAAQRGEAPPAPVAVEPEALITSEQVAAAFSEDPTKGVDLMNKMTQQQIDRAGEHFMKRISPMLSGAGGAIEAEARRKYPDEFDIYKEDIKALLERIPDKGTMSSMQSWDDMIAYVRGKDPMRLFAHMQKRDSTKAAADAQERERVSAGASMSSSQRSGAPAGTVVMDETTREICRNLNMTEEDYIKWSKVS